MCLRKKVSKRMCVCVCVGGLVQLASKKLKEVAGWNGLCN